MWSAAVSCQIITRESGKVNWDISGDTWDEQHTRGISMKCNLKGINCRSKKLLQQCTGEIIVIITGLISSQSISHRIISYQMNRKTVGNETICPFFENQSLKRNSAASSCEALEIFVSIVVCLNMLSILNKEVAVPGISFGCDFPAPSLHEFKQRHIKLQKDLSHMK
jgi:hypothetical protein